MNGSNGGGGNDGGGNGGSAGIASIICFGGGDFGSRMFCSVAANRRKNGLSCGLKILV